MQIDLLSATLRDEIIAAQLREFLPPLGLTERSIRIWIDGSQPPVRRIFELQLLKGASMKASWGFSLDFVPHISGGRVRWHRSDKSAMLDVIIDPRHLPTPSFLHGSEHLAADLRKLLPEAVAKAQESWIKGSTFHGMLDIIREIREHNTNPNCFGFYNYSQLPLAYAFLSAKVGDMQSAEQEIELYVTSRKLDDDEASTLKQSVRNCAG